MPDCAVQIAMVLEAARHASSADEDCFASAVGCEKAFPAESVRFADGVQLSGIAGEMQ